MMRAAAALAFVTVLAPSRGAGAQEFPGACDLLAEFDCVYAAGPGNTELRTVVDLPEWQALPIDPWSVLGPVGLIPGALVDRYGVVLGGASSLESGYELDGLDVSGIRWGGRIDASPLPLTLTGRMVARRGGLAARMRGGTGAQVSLASPQGGDHVEAGLEAHMGPARSGASELAAMPAVIDWSTSASWFNFRTWASGADERWSTRWYASVGALNRYATTTRVFSRATDRDGDGVPDRNASGAQVLEPVETVKLDSDGYLWPALVHIDAEPAPSQQVAITGFLGWQRATDYQPIDGEPAALARRERDVTADVVASWRGAFDDTALAVTAGQHWHRWTSRSPFEEQNRTPGGYVRLPDGFLDHESQTVRDACSDGAGDDYPQITNCPGLLYWGGGVGDLRDDPDARQVAHAGAMHFLQLHGQHILQAGIDLEQSSYTHHHEYSGGVRTEFLAEVRHVELGSGAGFDDLCAGQPCRWLDATDLRSRTRSLGAYLSEDWSPIEQVTVSLGGRVETQQVQRLGTLTDLVPRLGLAWDPLGRGHSRLFVATGGYIGRMPLYFNDRAFAGVDSYRRIIDPDTLDVVDESVEPFTAMTSVDGLGPVRVNELLAGGEVALGKELRAGLSLMRRDLGRIIEDSDGVIRNPSARRDYDELSVELRSNPDRPLALRASYTLSRLRGDWQGFLDDDAAAPGLLPLFDIGELGANTDGPLPPDRTHALDIGASYRHKLRQFDQLTVGLRATAWSGTPTSARGSHPTHGFGRVFILPRGRAGRTPLATQLGLRLQYTWRERASAFLDVLDLFDRQEPSRVDEIYTFDDVAPIVGGGPEDLPFLKRRTPEGAETSEPAGRNPRFGEAVDRYAPYSIWLGLRYEL